MLLDCRLHNRSTLSIDSTAPIERNVLLDFSFIHIDYSFPVGLAVHMGCNIVVDSKQLQFLQQDVSRCIVQNVSNIRMPSFTIY